MSLTVEQRDNLARLIAEMVNAVTKAHSVSRITGGRVKRNPKVDAAVNDMCDYLDSLTEKSEASELAPEITERRASDVV